jgi:hypothetical protein
VSVLSDVDARHLVARHLVIIKRLHLFLSLCVKHADVTRRITYEDKIAEEIDTADYAIVLVVRLLK